MKNTKTFEMLWRNKWITDNAKNIDDMIRKYAFAITTLEKIKADGLEGNFDDADDDYVVFYTQNEMLAKKYSMNEIESEFIDE